MSANYTEQPHCQRFLDPISQTHFELLDDELHVIGADCTSAAAACAQFASTLRIPAPIYRLRKPLRICIYSTKTSTICMHITN